MLCKGMTKKPDPFTTSEEAQEDPKTDHRHTTDILEELEGVCEHELEPTSEDFVEKVDIQLHPTIHD